MIRRIVVSLFAVTGALGASQAPEVSQQYLQRVGGAVDELGEIVRRFDSDAQREGLDRDGAIEDLEASGSDFARGQGGRMRQTIARYDRLSAQYAALQEAGPFERTWIVARNPDPALLSAAVRDYAPAVPTTVSGAGHAGIGAGLLGMVGLILAAPFRGRRRARA